MKFYNFIEIKLIISFLLVFASTASSAQESGSLSYRELPELVKGGNYSVQSARLMVKASEKRTGHLLRSFLPTIKASAGYENYTTFTFDRRTDPYGGVEASINVFRFGKDGLESKIRDSELRKSKAASRINFNSKLFEARQIFWKIVYHKELIDILEAAKKRNQGLLKAANRRINRGITTKTDRLDFDLYQTDLVANIESIKHENKILKIALGKYLGRDVSRAEVGFGSIPHEHDEGLISEAFNKEVNSTVELANASSDFFQLKGKKAKRWWTPSIDVYGGYGLYTLRQRDLLDQADRDDSWVGIRLTMNIFDGNKSSSESASYAAKAEAAKMQLKHISEEESTEFKIIQEEMKHAHELTHVSEEKVKKGEAYFKRTLSEYDKGVKNSLDALSSLQRIVSFKAEYAKIRLDYQSRKAALQKMKGI